MKKIIAVILVLVCTLLNSEQNQDLLPSLFNFDWKKPGTYELHNSHSSIQVPEDHYALIHQDAVKFLQINGNYDDAYVELVTIDNDFHAISFSYFNVGYVSLDDWNNIDPNSYLETIMRSTAADNEKRKQQGFSELNIIGWLVEPILDRTTHTVLWAIETESEGKQMINAVALKLGRNGFEKIVSVVDKNSLTRFDSELDLLLKSFSFVPGYQYTDYIKGDLIAQYTVAQMINSPKIIGYTQYLIPAGVILSIALASLWLFMHRVRPLRPVEC